MSSLGALSVLVVDDSQQMRAITSAVLSGMGVGHIHEAAGADAAVRILRTETIDVAVVDYKMAPLNGVEFTRMVRNLPESPNRFLPIIMLTGHADRRRIFEARDAGVTEFMVKPITAKALVERLHAVIMRPRPFVKLSSGGYFGPDRRRAVQANAEARRRATD